MPLLIINCFVSGLHKGREKNPTTQNPRQLNVAHEFINDSKIMYCGIVDN